MPSRECLHIALLTDGVTPYVVGGIQRHSRKLCEHLLRLGARVTLYHTATEAATRDRAKCLEGWDPGLKTQLRHVFVDWPGGFWYPGHYLRDCQSYSHSLLRAFMQRQQSDQVDFVYAQGLTGMAFTAARRQGARVPPVGVNAHGYEMFQRCIGLRARAGQILLRTPHRRLSIEADIVFSFSGKIYDIVQREIGVPSDRIRVIPNAVDAAWISGHLCGPGPTRRFIFVGRFERRKGVQELSEAIRCLEGCDWTIDFVGPIPEREQVQDSRVRYVGLVREEKQLMRLYDACDCIVAPSYAEGMPTVLIEAMARGLTLIATDVGAVGEMVAGGKGILLDSPAPAQIRHAMHRVATMSDAELMHRKSSARDASRNYTWEVVAEQTLQAISDRIEDE
jgi:glycosyltransferase involved in cell wall biosynthesis